MSKFDSQSDDLEVNDTDNTDSEVRKSSKVGIAALILAGLGFLSTFLFTLFAGLQLSQIPPKVLTELDRRVSGSANPITQEDLFQLVSQEHLQILANVGVLFGASILLGAILGLAAIIVGIVGAAKKRGRLQSAAAIALAVVYPIIGVIVFTVAGNLSAV
jgi:hypothetical protein